MELKALAFLSYSRFDDQHEGGRLTQLREYLEKEVRFQTATDFSIFQDRLDIKWGQKWKERIDNSIDSTTFLIPIVTPSFFKSDACKDEVTRFLHRESELNRNDLILPIYYTDCRELNDPAVQSTGSLATEIANRQYADWRPLRFKDFESADLRAAVADLARNITEALERKRVSVSPQRAGVIAQAVPEGARLVKRFQVNANEKWQATGVRAMQGQDLYVIWISGGWTANPGHAWYTADGYETIPAKPGYAVPDAPEGSLVGRVEDTAFHLGGRGRVPEDVGTGELYLTINDDLDGRYGVGYVDNRGHIQVEIYERTTG